MIPSREQHDRLIRKIWLICGSMAVLCFFMMSGTVIYMKSQGYDSKDIVNVQLIIVYIAIPLYLFGYVAPALAASLIKMSLGVDMSREGLDLTKDMAREMKEMKDEVRPLIEDGKTLAAEIKPMIVNVQNAISDGKKVFDEVVKEIRQGNGALNGKISHTIKKAIEEARSTMKDAEGDFERLIWSKVDKFLGGVFESKDESPT